jgi:hypothetical protein
MSEEIQPIGQVTHYFDRISVAVVYLWQEVAIGNWIHLYGPKTNFVQQVHSMQIDHQPIEEAFAEQEIAIQVEDKVRKGDYIYPYTPDEQA